MVWSVLMCLPECDIWPPIKGLRRYRSYKRLRESKYNKQSTLQIYKVVLYDSMKYNTLYIYYIIQWNKKAIKGNNLYILMSKIIWTKIGSIWNIHTHLYSHSHLHLHASTHTLSLKLTYTHTHAYSHMHSHVKITELKHISTI